MHLEDCASISALVFLVPVLPGMALGHMGWHKGTGVALPGLRMQEQESVLTGEKMAQWLDCPWVYYKTLYQTTKESLNYSPFVYFVFT